MSVPELVFRGRRPGATALVHQDRLIAYGRLDRAAAVAADDLHDAGVRPGAVVPVLLPRGPELVAVLLGILRLGAAYAVLDPAWPAARLDQVRSGLAEPVDAAPPDLFDRHPAGRAPHVDVRPDDRCAVFFTSGSTGAPKGVPSSHRALTDLLRPGGMPFPMTSATVLTQAAALPWDAMALELWGPLLAGGTSVLVDHLTPAGLRRSIAAHGQNTLWLTASLFNLLVDEDPDCFRGLRHVAVGGERLSPRHVGEFLTRHDIALYNGYGPVEGCVFATVHKVSEADCARPDGIPVGRAVRGTEVLVLAGDRRCAPGEAGEICLAGHRLSEGYLGDPELTAERFPVVGGRRVYRTGDRGWCGPDGVHHLVGRLDRQVKIRGHRVEPAEVERAILAHPGVSACTVVARPGPDGPRLVAAYQARNPLALRDFLGQRLPQHLVPDEIVPMTRLPLLPTGKVDVAAVRDDAVLTEVRGLVKDVTGRTVGAGDSLPAAGVNSLRLLRLVMRVGKRFGTDIAPAAFLADPTAARLATLVRAARPRPERRREPRSRYGLTPSQAGFLATERVDPANRLAWHCLLAWRVEGPVRTAELRAAVHVVHRRHQPLHARYTPDAAMVRPPTEPEFVVVPAIDDVTAENLLRDLLTQPFDLARGPVWRAVLVRQPTRALFGVAVHHVAFDGWSEHVLAAELSAVCAGRRPLRDRLPWPRPPAAAPADRAALTEELRGVPPLLVPRTGGGTEPSRVLLDVSEQACAALARRHRASTFVVGLAAFAAAVRTVTGQDDFAVAVPVIRRRPDAEHAIGCLLNVLCLRLRSSGDDQAAVIADAARGSRAGLAAQDVPFTETLALLAPDHRGRRFPAAMFVAQENQDPELVLPGCRTELLRPQPRWTGFDLLVERWPGQLSITHRPSVPAAFATALAKAMSDFLG